jgi:hypothetical protein
VPVFIPIIICTSCATDTFAELPPPATASPRSSSLASPAAAAAAARASVRTAVRAEGWWAAPVKACEREG